MKKILLCLILAITFFSCNNSNTLIDTKYVTTDFYITHVATNKYSKVQGYIIYNGIKLQCDNGNTGYYYKKYNLKPGDIINQTFTVYVYNYFTNNPYSDDVRIHVSDVNVFNYEY